MVRESKLLAPWAVLPLVLPALSCAEDEQGFGITDVDFDGREVLTLRFSEPLAELGEVDPADFRISWARTYRLVYGEDTLELTSYEDLGYVLYDNYYNQLPFVFTSAELGASSRELILRADPPLPDGLCQQFADARSYIPEIESYYGPGSVVDFILFLHYAAGDIPIASESGSVLGDIGPDWVLEDNYYLERESFGFTLNPRVGVPCPLP